MMRYGRVVLSIADVEASPLAPPRFVQLLANPVRWALLQQLGRSDRTVRELTELVDQPQNLVSYHLRRLRDAGLVTARRSSADGRDSYHTIDLTACREALAQTGAALHPALRLTAPAAASAGTPRRRRRPRVLFLCTGNSARSQIAEALTAHLSGGGVLAASAGSHPKPLHHHAVRVMRRYGIDIATHRSKHLDELARERFDKVITLCDRVREICPEFPNSAELVHWSIPDPALESAEGRSTYPAFRRTAAELETRIDFLLPQLTNPHTGRSHTHARR